MNNGAKRPPKTYPRQGKSGWQPGQRHSPNPGVAQPKMLATPQVKQPPSAPPAYRPQPVPRVLQAKRASGQQPPAVQSPRQPVAPPVYRPEPKKIVQPKMAAPARKPPVAPPVYRPQSKSLQPKSAQPARAPTPITARQPLPPARPLAAVQAKPAANGIGRVTPPLKPKALMPPVKPAPARPIIQAKPVAGVKAQWQAAQGAALQRKAAAAFPMARKAGQGSGVVQMAGTKPRTFSQDGRYLVKLSSDREEFIYRERGALGVDNILPGYHRTVGIHYDPGIFSRDVNAVDVSDGHGGKITIPLRDKLTEPSADQRILVIDTLGFEDNPVSQAQSFMMDIKIGEYTKSGEQFELEGASAPKRLLKNVEHDFKDTKQRTSRALGFDICSGQADFDREFDNAVKGQGNAANFRSALDKILADIKVIKQTMRNDTVTFVGASVFCMFNLTRPQNSVAKLIDPDHPIILDDNLAFANPKPLDVMDSHAMARQNQAAWFSFNKRDWNAYQQKWNNSFKTGLGALITFFKGKKNALPGQVIIQPRQRTQSI